MSEQDRSRELQSSSVRQFPGARRQEVPGTHATPHRFPSQSLNDPFNDDVQSLTDYLEIVLRYSRLIVGVVLCALVVSIVYAYSRTPIFTSLAKIELEQQQPERSKDHMYDNPTYTDYQSYFLTQKEILTSLHLVKALVEHMEPGTLAEFNSKSPSLTGWIRRLVSGWVWAVLGRSFREGDPNPQYSARDALCDAILKRISVKPVKKSNIMAVGIDAADPKLAQEMLKNLLDLYFEQSLDNRRKQSLQAAGWLKEEVRKSEKKLRKAQTELVDFTIDHGNRRHGRWGIGPGARRSEQDHGKPYQVSGGASQDPVFAD